MKKSFLIATIFALFSIQASECRAQQADAVFKLIKHEWTVNADGTSDYHYRHEVQIMRNRALTAYADKGETFVVYNPDIEELTVNEVYTVQADGRRVEMPQNAFIYQLPGECADCGRFNHLRELAMVHTGMEIGCVVVVDYTIHRQYNLVNETLPLMRECPIDRYEASISVPEGQELNVQLNKNTEDMPFAVEQSQTTTKYSLTARNIPQMPNEPYMPEGIRPTLRLMNGTPEWTPTFDEAPFAGAEEAMGQTMNSRDAKENVVAARNFFIDNIKLNDIDPVHLGYTHSTAAETWQSGCGTAADKANLLAAVLRHEGLRARVMGEQMDMVGVMIDTLEYTLDIRHRTPLALIGEAKDEVDTVSLTTTVASPKLDTLEGGFYQLDISAPYSTLDARRLPLQRTMPLQAKACHVDFSTTYTLPKGVKMVGKAISEGKAYEGVGSLSVSVKQSGKKLVVSRSLALEKSIVDPQHYKQYRDLLATWQSYDKITLQGK